MTTIYFWFARNGGVGHVSAKISNEYVSYWPGGAGADPKKDVKIGQSHEPHFMSQYDRDWRAEGKRHADAQLTLTNINEEAALKAWKEIKDNEVRYNMRRYNCSTVIAFLIEVGSQISPSFVPTVDLGEYDLPWMLRIAFRLRTFGNQVKMWTPESVYRYALEIAQHTP